ncbi:MAG: DUF4214 domain-containing protein, partial [Sulfurovum sp.]|nr:DUF4214 domain-containing protein [Sulfurovaceae bacterium]
NKILFIVLFTGILLHASPKSQSDVTKLYIATFDRAPDSYGLQYWINTSKLELEGVAQSFFDQEETKEKYPINISNQDFINYVYSNLFKREPDPAGFNYWLNELTNHGDVIHRSVFILAIINGAKDNDLKILDNKTIVGLSFAHDGRNNLIEASAVVDNITADDSSVTEVLHKYAIPKYNPDQGTDDIVDDNNATNDTNATADEDDDDEIIYDEDYVENDTDDNEDNDAGDGSSTSGATEGGGGEKLPPTPAHIAALVESTRSARERLVNYIPDQNQSFNYGKEFFISTIGDDNNNGTIDNPFATLTKARDSIRIYKESSGIPSGGIVVWLREGNYKLLKGVDFSSVDSGEEGSPIAYRGYKDEKVRIMGAIPISSDWFKSVDNSDPLWDRLDIGARDNIKVVNLKEHGITNLGKLDEWHYASNTPLELFDDMTSLEIARWPDRDQSDTIPYYTDSKINIYGDNLSPDVTGSYTKNVNIKSTDSYYSSFKKDDLVDGKQYYIRHFKAQSDEVRRTWAITMGEYKNSPFEYSGTGYSIPRDFTEHSTTASGIPMTIRFEDIQFGFASMKKGLSNRKFEYVGDRPSRWENSGDLWVNEMFHYAWRNEHIPITSIDTTNKTITMKYDDPLGIKQKEIKRQYYVYNILEELTTAGEYFVDRESSKLYYYPKRDLSISKLYGSMIEYYMINFDGASFVEFHDMALEMSRQDIVRFSSGSHNIISHLKLRLSGRNLVKIDEASSYSGVEYSELSESGERAVVLDGGDPMTLTNGYNFVTNNHIIGDNRLSWTSQGAIGIRGVGNIAEHNDIHGYKHQAINYASNNCSISYNNIYDVLKYTEDAGVIYSGRSWNYRGNKI